MRAFFRPIGATFREPLSDPITSDELLRAWAHVETAELRRLAKAKRRFESEEEWAATTIARMLVLELRKSKARAA